MNLGDIHPMNFTGMHSITGLLKTWVGINANIIYYNI